MPWHESAADRPSLAASALDTITLACALKLPTHPTATITATDQNGDSISTGDYNDASKLTPSPSIHGIGLAMQPRQAPAAVSCCLFAEHLRGTQLRSPSLLLSRTELDRQCLCRSSARPSLLLMSQKPTATEVLSQATAHTCWNAQPVLAILSQLS